MAAAFPVHVPLGAWQLHPHLVFEALAYTLGFQAFLLLRRRTGDHLDSLTRGWLVAAAVMGAAIGAKALYWLADPAHMHPLQDPQLFWGGKTVLGAIVGGHLVVEWAKRRMGVTARTGDMYVLPLAIGIVVGRVGCFLSGLEDATHGVATGLPWGVDFGDGIARHPTQLYEIVAVGAIAATAWWRMRSGAPAGTGWRTFLVGYAAWRLLVGAIQPMHRWGGLGALQWAALAVVVWAAYSAWRARTTGRRTTAGSARGEDGEVVAHA